MTIGQIKAAVMMLIDQYTPDSPPTDDEETLAKLNTLIELSQVQLCQMKKTEKRCMLPENGGQEESETGLILYPLPQDFYQLHRVTKDGDEVWADVFDNELAVKAGQGALVMSYYAYPPEITQDTDDDTRLWLDRDILQVLPYAVAADLLKADPSADYVAFEQKYMGLLANLDPHKSAGRLVVRQMPGQGGV